MIHSLAPVNDRSSGRRFNGKDPTQPIYVAIRGRVFDVTRGFDFYGPEGPYEMFPGK